MRHVVLLLVALSGCATTHLSSASERTYEPRDYLQTAYEALVRADTDTGGHRIRAELETRAALQALGDEARHARAVPFDGPPSMQVALELLQATEPQLTQNVLARTHTERAVAELREALH